ncbi:Do family serine endopeptidase [Piscirickettsia litoralis]|uniref:Peptidase Do family protein n=1 Tax=Piscirickettsia litoralis TaxID=1891921 RepID=A0ABX3A831_9GAMM|nr:Do family serine endopeptidase [Piscirickettsia litoralis]ODN43715.1 peptidase Do family protein [Piscirickettsia litoralis]
MKKTLACALLSCSLVAPALSYAELPQELVTKNSIAPMLKSVMPAVVNISNLQHVDFSKIKLPPGVPKSKLPKNPILVPKSTGSGVIIDAKKGYILTNYHVIADAKKIRVTLKDGRQLTAKVIGDDKGTDIAVIEIKAKDLEQIKIPKKGYTPNVGDFVVAVGSPYGLSQTVTSGIISALDRNNLGIEGFENFIQTDAPINPGNSGGALVNLKGQLVGINTAILSPDPAATFTGIGFAIPWPMAKSISQQIIKYGEVKRGQLGVYAQNITPELSEAMGLKDNEGAIVTDVMPNSAAAIAGIKIGDIITEIDKKDIHSAADLRNSIGLIRVGDKATIQLLKDGKRKTVTAELISPKAREKVIADNDPYLVGMTLQQVENFSPKRGLIRGVKITELNTSSAAWNAGLRQGDIIRDVNGHEVNNLKQFINTIKKNDKEAITLNVARGQGALYVVLHS